MNGPQSFAKIIARCSREDLLRIIQTEEFPDIAAWLAQHQDDPKVATALRKLMREVRAH